MSTSTEPLDVRESQLLDFCKDQTAWFTAKSRYLGSRLRLYRALVLFCSVSVTVLSGIPEVKTTVPWSITVASGLATFFAGLLTMSKTEENYVNHMTAAGQFRRELMLYQQHAGAYASLDQEKQLQLLAERIATFDEENYSKAAKQLRAVSEAR